MSSLSPFVKLAYQVNGSVVSCSTWNILVDRSCLAGCLDWVGILEIVQARHEATGSFCLFDFEFFHEVASLGEKPLHVNA
jgi:hypothetical protein